MTVFIDDQAVALEGGCLREVLQAAGGHLASSGRTVVEVELAGEPLDPQQLDAQMEASVADAQVRLYTADPRELAVQTLRQVQGALAEAADRQAQAADLLQQDQVKPALEHVGQALQIWRQAGQAVLQAAQLVGLDLDQRPFQGQPVAGVVQALAQQLRDLAELVVANDTLGLADALAYEWPETTERWTALIDELIGWIQDEAA